MNSKHNLADLLQTKLADILILVNTLLIDTLTVFPIRVTDSVSPSWKSIRHSFTLLRLKVNVDFVTWIY